MTVYGAPWRPHCKRVKKFLAAHRVRYANVDIDAQPEAIERVKELQLGSAVGDGIAALLMTRRYLEAHHHKAVALVDA